MQGKSQFVPGTANLFMEGCKTGSFPSKRRGEANDRKLSDLPVAGRMEAMTIQPIRCNKNRSWASSLGMVGML